MKRAGRTDCFNAETGTASLGTSSNLDCNPRSKYQPERDSSEISGGRETESDNLQPGGGGMQVLVVQDGDVARKRRRSNGLLEEAKEQALVMAR